MRSQSNTLENIFKKQGRLTDKLTRHSYIPVYERLFEPLRDCPLSILEIGISRGGSILAWEEYFQNALITCIDINPNIFLSKKWIEKVNRSKRIHPILCDINDVKKFNREIGSRTFDIVIDDGSHKIEDQISSVKLLFPKLNKNGMLFIEDVEDMKHEAHFVKEYGLEVFDLREEKGRYDDILFLIKKIVH
jgi:hypothetical protein